MVDSMVTDTPANGSMTTIIVCLNCPMSMYGNNFGVDLICLPLIQLDVILDMNQLDFDHVHINCFDKTVMFPEPEESADLRFISSRQVETFLKEIEIQRVLKCL